MRARLILRFVAFGLMLAACARGGPSVPPLDASARSEARAAQELIIYHWWTAGGEREGVDALFRLYRQSFPQYQVIDNPVPGGAGLEIKAVMKSLMLGGSPPTTFQVHAGAELKSYVDFRLVQPVTELWRSEGYEQVYPEAIKRLLKFGDDYYAVPVGVHRANLVWYNRAVFEKAGVSEPHSLGEFLTALDRLEAAGVTPLAVASGSQWEAAHLFEQLLLAVGGPDLYLSYFQGQIGGSDPQVVQAAVTLERISRYINRDHAALTWDQAAAMVGRGEAAMTVMGDWAQGYFQAAGWQYERDYGAFPFPGTGDLFNIVVDTFALASGAPGKEAGFAWLRIAGSREGGELFNPVKGSVSPRLDITAEGRSSLARRNTQDLRGLRIIPSAVHGVGAPEGFMADWSDAVARFLQAPNVPQFIDQLDQIAHHHQLGK